MDTKFGCALIDRSGYILQKTILCIKSMKNDITLVMMVKDEAVGLQKAIESAREFVDEVHVAVDRTSTDGTQTIARRYADRVTSFDFNNDFSKIRNQAMGAVTTKWVLILDGHEYISEIGKVREYLKTDCDVVLVKVRLETGMTFMHPRIFRTGKRYQGKYHEQIEVTKPRACPSFEIVHDRIHGQSEESTKARIEQREKMLPEVMKENIRNNSRDTLSLFHLGNWYFSRQEWARAKLYYGRHLQCSKDKEEMYFVALNKALCHAMLGEHIRAEFAFLRAERIMPNRWETRRLHGGHLLICECFKWATEELEMALKHNERHYMYEPYQQDLHAIWMLIAGARFGQKKYREAQGAAKKAQDTANNQIEINDAKEVERQCSIISNERICKKSKSK